MSERINKYFPLPKSNRGFKPSSFIQTLILMQHEGGFHLDDVRHIHEDEALKMVLNLKQLPKASSIGGWLRRMGNNKQNTWVGLSKAKPNVCYFHVGLHSSAQPTSLLFKYRSEFFFHLFHICRSYRPAVRVIKFKFGIHAALIFAVTYLHQHLY